MRRKDHERFIEQTFGLPGTSFETDLGNTILLDVVRELGFAALTDTAIERVAAYHRLRDNLGAGQGGRH